MQRHRVARGGGWCAGSEVEAFAAAAGRAAPDATLRRGRNNPDFRDTVDDKRQIHGVLVEAGEKLPGAVERVDKKKLRSGLRMRAPRACFFRNDRYARHEPGKSFEQQRFRRLI